MDACKILTAADVAAALKQKVSKALGGGEHCMYQLEAPKAIADAYDFYLNDAATTEILLQMKKGPEKGTPVPGLWSEAYVGPARGDTPNLLSVVSIYARRVEILLRSDPWQRSFRSLRLALLLHETSVDGTLRRRCAWGSST